MINLLEKKKIIIKFLIIIFLLMEIQVNPEIAGIGGAMLIGSFYSFNTSMFNY